MTFSFATKLHLLLILVIIAIGLYMFMLYKEVKVFQDELVSMKSQLKAATTAAAAVAIRVVPAMAPVLLEEELAVLPVIIEEEDDVEPDQSVTSKEIKDLLSSIQKDGEVEAEVEAEVEPEAEPDYSTMTPEELKHVKYETLKSYLKSKGHQIKGTKADMIKRIGELFCS